MATEPVHTTDTDDPLQAAYEDRNLAVMFALRLAKHRDDCTVFWRPAEEDTGEAWPFVGIVTPVGQSTWQIPPDELEPHKDWLPEREIAYDGHVRAEKNERILAFLENMSSE